MELYAVVGGSTHNLYDGTYCWFSAHDGLGLSPLTRLLESGVLQHGATDFGFLLQPRVFNLVLALGALTDSAYYTRRNSLQKILSPGQDTALRFVLDNGTTRQIDARLVGAPMGVDAGDVPLLGKLGFQFVAPDPTFYDPTEQSVTFSIGGSGGGAFEIPLAIPWAVGASALNSTVTIAYGGTWRAHPIIRIVGPITDCVITNETTDEKLDLTGVTIGAGDYYEIDTRYGHKTVYDSAGNRKVGDLTDDSDLGTFHLAEVYGADTSRDNDIRVDGTGVTEVTEVYIRWQVRYLGI